MQESIRKMFDSIAPEYDRLNHILSLNIDRIWRRRALRKIIDRQHPQLILDLACGTGDFSMEIADHTCEGSHIYGVDISEGMLEVMRRKIADRKGAAEISIRTGNAESLDFPDNSFDRVTIGFGIRNFEHRDVALREILRVLKPGGRLVILELSVPSNRFVRALYNLYFTRILPIIGGKVSGDKSAYRYLPESVLKFPGKKQWMALMRDCGYINVTHRAFSLGICRMYCGEK